MRPPAHNPLLRELLDLPTVSRALRCSFWALVAGSAIAAVAIPAIAESGTQNPVPSRMAISTNSIPPGGSVVFTVTNEFPRYALDFGDGSSLATNVGFFSVSHSYAGATNLALSRIPRLTTRYRGGSSTVAAGPIAISAIPPPPTNTIGALLFDGLSAYAEATNAPALLPVNGPGMTVECWVNFLEIPGNSALINMSDTDGWAMLANNAGVYIDFKIGNSDNYAISTLPTTQQWHHVAGVWDGSQVEMFVDGVPSGSPASFSGPFGATSLPMQIATGSGGLFQHSIVAQVRITTNAVYAIGATFTPANTLTNLPDTVCLYTFTEGSGTSSADHSPSGFNLTLFNGVTWTNR